MEGVLVLDKPAGPTSMRAVERVKRALRVRKAGHAGTLDPAATGILPICLGAATRLVPYLQGGDKEYLATVRFGLETDTLDLDGQVLRRAPVPLLTADALAPHLAVLTGAILQRPPAFSALRSGGERLHEKARRGEAVEVEPRPVVVHDLDLLRLEPPDVHLRVRCGKGTYVRSLAADLGQALGCGACLAALRRTRVGLLGLEAAVGLEELEERARRGETAALLLPMAEALAHLPAVVLTEVGLSRVAQGQPIRPEDLAAPPPIEGAAAEAIRLLDREGRLAAIAEPAPDALLAPRRVFAGPK